MTAIALVCDTEPEVMICEKCGNSLVVAEWQEYVSDGFAFIFWRCWECGYQFDTETYVSDVGQEMADSSAVEQFFPSLLVA